MATVSTFNVALIASTARFVTAISQAERRWNQFARSVERHAKTMPEAIRKATAPSLALGRQVAKGAAIAGAALSALSGVGVRLAAQYEQTTIAFETLLGSAEAADRFLRELDVFARRTPFDAEQLRQASRQLLAYGFAADMVLKMLTPIGDAMAAMGGNVEVMERVIKAIGQIQSSQRLQAEEMEQLVETGIPAWRYLAETLNTTVADAMERVRKRQVDAATAIGAILRGMSKDFGGAMERQSRTILGQWQQVQEGLTIITRGIGQDIIRITGLAGAMMALNDAIGRFADTVARAGSFLEALKTALPPWLPAVIFATAGAIMGALVPAITAWLIPALRKLGTSLIATLAPLRVWIAAGAAAGLVAWLVIKNWSRVAAGIKYAAYAASGFIVSMASTAVRAVAWMVNAIGFIIPWARGAASYLYGLSNRMDAFAVRLIRTGQAAWAAAKSAKASADNLRQVKEVADGAARTTQRVGDAASRLANAADRADKAHRRLAKGLKDAGKAAANNLQSFDEVHQIETEMGDAGGGGAPDIPVAKGYEDLANLLDGIADKIGNIGAATQDLTSGIEGPLSRFKSLWEGSLPSIAKVAAELLALKRIAEPLSKLKPIRWTFQVVGKGIELVGRVIEWVRNLRPVRWTFEVVGKGLGQISRVVEWVRNLRPVKWVFEVVGKGLRIIDQVIAWVKGLRPVKWMVNIAGNAPQWLGTVTKLFGRLGPLVSKVLGPILRFVAPIGQFLLLIDVGRTLLDLLQRLPGYWNEFTNAFQRVLDGIKMIASGNIIEGLKTAFSGIGDLLVLPFKIAAETIDSFLGHFFGQELWQKIKGWLGNIAAAIGDAWDTIRALTADRWTAIGAAVATAADHARARVTTAWEITRATLGSIWDALRALAAARWQAIAETVGSWVETARLRVVTAWQMAQAGLAMVWEMIRITATTVWMTITTTIGQFVEQTRLTITMAWTAVQTWLSQTWTMIQTMALQRWQAIATTIGQWTQSARNTIASTWEAIKTTLATAWDLLRTWASEKWQAMTATISEHVETAQRNVIGAWTDVRERLSGLWNSIKTTAASVWDGIRNTIRSVVNSIISYINRFIRAINSIEISLPSVDIPGIGQIGGWSIRFLQIPEIPYLARGGDITGSGLAVVGEAGPELLHLPRGARVTPLSGGGDIENTIYRAVYQAMYDVLSERAAETDQAPEIVLKLNDRTLARAVLPSIIAEGHRQGLNLVVRPQGV